VDEYKEITMALGSEDDATTGRDHNYHSVDEIREDVILADLQRAGIQTLEDFARRYAEAVNASVQCNPRSSDMFLPAMSPALGGSRVRTPYGDTIRPNHRSPRVRFRIDGTIHEPEDIESYADTPLHLVIDQNTPRQDSVTGFTDPSSLQDHLLGVDLLQREASAFAASAGSLSNETGYCYEHPGFTGAVLRIPRMNEWWNFSLPDLTRLYRSCFLFWCWDPWNDIISSVRAQYYPIRLFEHINFAGSSLTVAPWSEYNNLADLGWNDRVSSLSILI
jgi:hypothetical protein